MIIDFIMYASSAVLLRGISIITAPITMRLIAPSEYGLLALANSFISVLTLFLGLGLRQALSLEYFHCDRTQRREMINDIICIYSMITSAVFVLFFCMQHQLNLIFFAGQAQSSLIGISLCICALYFFVELLYQLLQYQMQAKKLALIQTGITLITVCLQLIALCYYHCGILSMLGAQLIGMSIAAGIGLYTYMTRQWHHHINLSRARRLCLYYAQLGLPFIPSVLFGWLLSSGDRWVLAQLTDMHAVGIYSLADTVTQLFNTVILYPISCSYIPRVLRSYHEHADEMLIVEQQNQKMMWMCMGGLATASTIGYVLCKPLALYIIPPTYHEAIDYMLLLLLGSIFLMGTYFVNCFIQFHKRRYFLGFSLVIPATLNIALNYLLIPYYKTYGCVYATVIAYATYFMITLWYNYSLQSYMQKSSNSSSVAGL